MVTDDFFDDEAQEFLAELRVEISLFGQFAQARYLALLARRVGRRQSNLRLVLADGLRDAKPLGQHMNYCSIDIVDALAVSGQDPIGFGRGLRFIGHHLQS